MHARYLPFLVFFAVAVISITWKMRRFAKLSRMLSSGQAGNNVIRVDTPLSGFDLKPDDSHDPAIASMPKYPGASPVDSAAPGSAAEIHVGGKPGRYLVQQLSTKDSVSVVADYYRFHFPDWVQATQYDRGTRFQQNSPGCFRAISIRAVSGRTHIQYEVVLTDSSDSMTSAHPG